LSGLLALQFLDHLEADRGSGDSVPLPVVMMPALRAYTMKDRLSLADEVPSPFCNVKNTPSRVKEDPLFAR